MISLLHPSILTCSDSLLCVHSFSLFFQIVLYLRMCLAHSAGATPLSARLADMQDDAPAIGRYVRSLLSSQPQTSGSKDSESNPVHVYIDLLQQLLSAVGGESSQCKRECKTRSTVIIIVVKSTLCVTYTS